jgi:hypothetical protein
VSLTRTKVSPEQMQGHRLMFAEAATEPFDLLL